MGRVTHPRDGLAVSGRRHIIDNVIGSTGLIAHSIIAEQGYLIRTVARIISSSQVHAALSHRQVGDVDLSIFVGETQQRIVGIYTDAGRSLSVLNDGNSRGSRTADDSVIRSNAVDSLNGVILHRCREAGNILVHFADVHSSRLLAAVGTLCDANVDAAALDHRGGNIHRNRGQSTCGIYIVINSGDVYCHHALGSIIIISTANTVGESHLGRILTSQRNAGAQGCDRCRITAVEFHRPSLAHCGCSLNIQRHAGQLCIVRNYGEVPCLAGDIAVAVLEIERYRVQSLAKVHERRGAAENVLVVRTAIRTVKVEIRGLHSGGKGIRLLVIVVGNEEAQVTGVERHTVLELRFGAVVVHELDGGHDRSRDVLIVCAIDGAQIVEKNIALQIGLVKFDTISCIPANAAGGDHGTEKHTLVNANLCTGILSHIRFEVLPARFHIGICLILSLTKIDIRFCPSCSAIGAGRDLAAHPRYWNTFGNVDPNA